MLTPTSSRRRAAARAVMTAVLLLAPLAAAPADARAGGGFSFGSRGSRTFSAPAITSTAPRTASPFQQTEVPRFRPGMAGTQPRRFGFGTGLLAGLFGAGLFGLFSGGGFFGGIAALFGLLFKLALIGAVIWLVLRLVRGRRMGPALAGGPANGPMPMGMPRSAYGAGAGAGVAPVTLQPADFDSFERALGAVQDAYGREDLDGLARLATPEMVRHFAGDLEANRRRNLRNDLSQVKLLQGDLSEAWREGSAIFATVAMRFSAVDVMVDRSSGRVAAGDPVRPVEATELWTFRRSGAGPWILSGIQQAG